MTPQAPDPQTLIDLRIRAAGRLDGPVDASGVAARAANALAVLHALASSPDTAADALALLHELQVHQVELDLQAEDLRESRLALEAALHRQTEMLDHQPVSCFSVDRQLVIRDVNLRGAALLGVSPEVALGLGLDVFFSADSAQTLQRLVANPGVGGSAGELAWRSPGHPDLLVRADVGPDPAGGFLVVLTNEMPMPSASDV